MYIYIYKCIHGLGAFSGLGNKKLFLPMDYMSAEFMENAEQTWVSPLVQQVQGHISTNTRLSRKPREIYIYNIYIVYIYIYSVYIYIVYTYVSFVNICIFCVYIYIYSVYIHSIYRWTTSFHCLVESICFHKQGLSSMDFHICSGLGVETSQPQFCWWIVSGHGLIWVVGFEVRTGRALLLLKHP